MVKKMVLMLLCIGVVTAAFGGTDFNGDGKDDIISFERGTTGNIWISLSNGSGFGTRTLWGWSFCNGNEVPAYGDFNGDGKDDIMTVIRSSRPSPITGDVYVALSTGSGFGGATKWHENFCIDKQIPMIGDVNKDGKDDMIVFYRSSVTGTAAGDVYVALSNGSTFGTATKWHESFCFGDEIPLVGDFNGDGQDDIATLLWNGTVYVAHSMHTYFGTAFVAHSSFDPKEFPFAADVNGDGKDDIVAFRRQCFDGRGTNMWDPVLRGDVMVTLSNGSSFAGNAKWNDWFCIDNEIPMVGDVNGDGKDDIITFLHEMQTGTARGDVYAAKSNGSSFGTGVKWHESFALNEETPTSEAALYPYWMYYWTYEDEVKECVAYCSNEEDRHETNAAKFVDEFDAYPCTQFYWGKSYMLTTSHLDFIDSADLAFCTGHGSASSITIYAGNTVDLTQCAWGSFSTKSRRADLDAVAFESCSMLKMDTGWRERWESNENRSRPFSGLHIVCGFRNTHQESPVVELSKQFAKRLDDRQTVGSAWLNAAEYEDDFVFGHNNEECIFFIRPHRSENVDSLESFGDRWYKHPDYILDTEY